MTKEPFPDTPEWPCQLPDFEVLGSLDTLALNSGGDLDDGDYMTYAYPPGVALGPGIPGTPASHS